MTRPGSVHVSGCTCGTCAITDGVVQVVIPATGGGVQGAQGLQGRTGVQGTQGTAGYIGEDGTQGASGAQGAQGTTGSGAQGTQGLQGVDGGGLTQQQVEDLIAASALETTDDLTEGTVNKYFTPARVSSVYSQGAASNSWAITHNLGFYPNVTVVDSGGSIVEGEIGRAHV